VESAWLRAAPLGRTCSGGVGGGGGVGVGGGGGGGWRNVEVAGF
jgi:hypothetical protein